MATPLVFDTIDDMLDGATDRVAIHPEDGKSGSDFELLVLQGQPRFLKVVSYEGDWITRCTGNTDYWEYKAWCAGLYHRVPAEIDTAMVAMALDRTGPQPRLAMLMTDVSGTLIPPGDSPVSVDQHNRLIDHMAAFHAAFWGWEDDVGLSSIESRLNLFSDANVAREMAAPDPPVPIRVAQEGWARLPERAPRLAEAIAAARADPATLGARLRETPLAFVAGDWKMGNLGSHDDGRTVVLDWAYPGASAPCLDLTWYLALNAARIPTSKEATIAAYRRGLEQRGIATHGWFDEQLSLSLLAAMVIFGWEKAHGSEAELTWWEQAVIGRPAR